MSEMTEIINTVGFPIGTAVACAIFIYKTQQQSREDSNKREERMFEQFDKFSDSMDKFNQTLMSIDDRLHDLEIKVK